MAILSEGLKVMVIGMGVVFVVLFLLSFILRLFKTFIYQEEKAVPESTVRKKTGLPAEQGTNFSGREEVVEAEEVALISAVLAGMLTENEYICKISQVN